jgi:hypothetical protein
MVKADNAPRIDIPTTTGELAIVDEPGSTAFQNKRTAKRIANTMGAATT